MTTSSHRYCVIMCGGIGSRFWPYSRTDNPKQFIDFFGTGRSLLQMTFDRMAHLIPAENILVVTNERYAEKISTQLPDILPDNILLEPDRRNTAPCIAWATYHIAAKDPEASIIVTPSDHLIMRESVFEECVDKGFDFVNTHNALLTIGIKPTRPETGYGYIQVDSEVEPGIMKVKTFTEKPDLELARVFVDSGEFFWNAGIFIWKSSSIKSALAKYLPDLNNIFSAGADKFGTTAEKDFIDTVFPSAPSISIDFGVMEKADNVYVECADLGWNDLGTWSSLYDISPKNIASNVTQKCNVMAYNSSGNIFMAPDEKLVVVSGLKDFIVADAGDVLLICPKAEEQRIRQMVNEVNQRFDDKFM